MQKSPFQRSRSVIAVCLALAGIASSPAALGGNLRVYQRSIDDWYQNNPGLIAFNFVDPPPGWSVFLRPGELNPGDDSNMKVHAELLERVMKDGRAEDSLKIISQGAPLTVYATADLDAWNQAGNPEDSLPQPVLQGQVNAQWLQLDFILPSPNQEIPFIFFVPEEGGEVLSGEQKSVGRGTFTDHAQNFGFTPGAEGRVRLTGDLESDNIVLEQIP